MTKYIFVLASLFLLLFSSCGDDSNENNVEGIISNGRGKVVFTDYEPLKDKPITLHYSVGEGDMSSMPIVFVLPGTNRDADNYIMPWKDPSNTYKCMVFALEFPAKYYTDDEYITGNVIDKSGALVNKQYWTFSAIEAIFNYIKKETGNKSTDFYLFGHSAGAQFVHRYVIFNPDAKIKKAVSANAGWYTMPDFTVKYPYGLKNTQLTANDVKLAFAKNMIIDLGQRDNDPNDASLRKTPEAMLQGAHRYARGQYFFTNSKVMASAGSYQFNWTKNEVPNVGHDQASMARDAAKLFFE